MKKSFILAILIATLSFGEGFMDMGMSGDLHIMLSSEKVLSEGANKVHVVLQRGTHGGKNVDAKDVRVKFFMPEMPGMPYMESKDICKKVDDTFECNVNFGMNGTWQYHLFIKDENNREHKYKGSVNLGQASSTHQHH